MLKIFGKIVIGGRSGKREQAYLMFILWWSAFAAFVVLEAHSTPMPGTQAILSLAFPMVVINLALAHGMEWVSSQTKWGAPAADPHIPPTAPN